MAEPTVIDWAVPRSRRPLVANGSEQVVWVDVAKLDASWSKDYVYIAPGGEGGTRTRYPDFGTWLKTRAEPVEMSEITINGSLDCVVFHNGRHRFSWVRDHGAQAVPVLVSADVAAEIEKRFGTPKRETVIF